MLYLKIGPNGPEFVQADEAITSYTDLSSLEYASGSSAQVVGSAYGIHTVDLPFPANRPYSQDDPLGTLRTTRVLLAASIPVTILGSPSVTNSIHGAAVRFGEENLAAVIDSEFPKV